MGGWRSSSSAVDRAPVGDPTLRSIHGCPCVSSYSAKRLQRSLSTVISSNHPTAYLINLIILLLFSFLLSAPSDIARPFLWSYFLPPSHAQTTMAQVTEDGLRSAISERLEAVHVEISDMSGTAKYFPCNRAG